MKFKTHGIKLLFCALTALLITLSSQFNSAIGYIAADFNWRPVFTTSINEVPSVTIIIDSSDSMHRMAYAINSEQGSYKWNGEAFNASQPSYYGYFNSSSKYRYVNSTINSGYFLEDNSSGNWDGKFMNWATMHRGDVLKKILTGGYYNSTEQWFEILTTNGVDKEISFSDTGTTKYTPYNYSGMTIYQKLYTKDLYINYKDKGKETIEGPFTLRIKPANPPTSVTGVLDKFKDKARFALFKFIDNGSPSNQHAGGELLVTMGKNKIDEIKEKINAINPTGQSTPLAETLYSVAGYVQQINPKSSTYSSTKDNKGRYNGDYPVNATADPFYFPEANNGTGGLVYCTQQNVILITGGESTFDEYIPNSIKQAYPDVQANKEPYKSILDPNGSPYLLNVGYWTHMTDLRTDLPSKQNMNLYTVFSFGRASHLLKHGSIYGGFSDKNGNGKPTPDPLDNLGELDTPPSNEYNTDGDKMPDNYFEATTGDSLEVAITNALDLATRSLMSGTAAAVTSQTRSGEGAVYQALFFPPNNAFQIAPAWTGQIHALFVDSMGNMREDTNKNNRLDATDYTIKFEDVTNSVNVNKYYVNGTRVNPYLNSTIEDVNFVWSTTDWLNANTLDTATQRIYTSNTSSRYIFTYSPTNANQTMVPSPSEIQPFTATLCDPNAVATNFCKYLTFYETTSGAIGYLNATNTVKEAFAKRQVSYIRGSDQNTVFSYGGNTYNDFTRSRKYKNNTQTWRLGDIVHSTPTIVGSPAENYDTLYGDNTYKAFKSAYRNRRQVLYSGANDGMLHAFNGGFYNSTIKGFELGSGAQYPLGMELWAYVPYNLLPHLRWLMNPDYGERYHASYVDLKPRVFDARLFTNSTTHPNGWGTVLVAGMRFGGAEIQAADRTMKSAYIIMDITDPEQPPTLLGEITMPNLGFTTCYPTVMPMSTPNTNVDGLNQWYLVFGSGPANAIGSPHRNLLDDYKSTDNPTLSNQAGNLYILDLKALVSGSKVETLGNDGVFSTSLPAFVTTEATSYIADPIAVDLDIGSSNASAAFKTDIIYFGTTAGMTTAPTGTVRRVTTNNILRSGSNANWQSSTLINLDTPLTSSTAVAMDETKRLWVYFGTGRFYNKGDIPQPVYMSFFGLKEPLATNSSNYSWDTINKALIHNSTNVNFSNATCGLEYTKQCVAITVTEPDGSTRSLGTVDGVPTPWDALLAEVAPMAGWRHDFSWNMERVIGQAAILGGAVLFTSYGPSVDICGFEGDSRLYAVYYKTGTAFYQPILNNAGDIFSKFIGLGKGMATSPNLHVGEGSGSSAFIQTSTGAIQSITIENPLSIKSGALFWRKNTN